MDLVLIGFKCLRCLQIEFFQGFGGKGEASLGGPSPKDAVKKNKLLAKTVKTSFKDWRLLKLINVVPNFSYYCRDNIPFYPCTAPYSINTIVYVII